MAETALGAEVPTNLGTLNKRYFARFVIGRDRHKASTVGEMPGVEAAVTLLARVGAAALMRRGGLECSVPGRFRIGHGCRNG